MFVMWVVSVVVFSVLILMVVFLLLGICYKMLCYEKMRIVEMKSGVEIRLLSDKLF